LVAGFVVLAVLAGVVAVVTIGDDETPVGGPAALSPGVEGLADQEAQGAGVTSEPVIRLETMPQLTDRTVSDAIVVLRRSGLPFVIVELFDPNTPTGAVLDQTPAPGTALDTGTAVTLVVSRGLQLTPVTEQDDVGLEAEAGAAADETAAQ
jgi:serine/threonine-protein kinase